MGGYFKGLAGVIIFVFLFTLYYKFVGSINAFSFLIILVLGSISSLLINIYIWIRSFQINSSSNNNEFIIQQETSFGTHSIGILYTSKISEVELIKKCQKLKTRDYNEIYIISPHKNDALRKELSNIQVKFVCSSDLKHYNNITWPRQKGKLESSITYFFDKFGDQAKMFTLIYDYTNFEPILDSNILNSFEEDNSEIILFNNQLNSVDIFNTPVSILLEENSSIFNAITLKNSALKKIKFWGQYDQPIRNMILAHFQDLKISILEIKAPIQTDNFIESQNKNIVEHNYERLLLNTHLNKLLPKTSIKTICLFFHKLLIESIFSFLIFISICLFNKNYGGIITAILIYETFIFLFKYFFQINPFISLTQLKKINYLKLFITADNVDVFIFAISTISISASFILLEIYLGINFAISIFIILIIWISIFQFRQIKWKNIQNISKNFKLKKFYIVLMLLVEIIFVLISLIGIGSQSKVYAIDTWLGRVNNQRLNLSAVSENIKLTNAAYKKVQYMFLKDTTAHSDPIDAFIKVSGYNPEISAEIMYVGVGSLENIFKYWTTKLEYYNQIVNPDYCEAGFWSESRIINGVAVNKSVLYLAKPKGNCPNKSSSNSSNINTTITSISTSTSKYSSQSSNITSSTQSLSTSSTTIHTINYTTTNTNIDTTFSSTSVPTSETSLHQDTSENLTTIVSISSNTHKNHSHSHTDTTSNLTTSALVLNEASNSLTSSTLSNNLYDESSSSSETKIQKELGESTSSKTNYIEFLAPISFENHPIKSVNIFNLKNLTSDSIYLLNTIIFSIFLIVIFEGIYFKLLYSIFNFIENKI